MREEEALRLVSPRVCQMLAMPRDERAEEARRGRPPCGTEGALMDANRFFQVSYDSRNHPKVRMLRMMGGGIVEYGRFVALLAILYDMDNRVRVGFPEDEAAAPECFMLASELGFDSQGELREWLSKAAACGIVDAEMLDALGVVASRTVGEQLEFRKAKTEAGRKGGRPRKDAAPDAE